jgi:prepilin-type N-terminal cleavage/methylation domain-containing protein
MVNYGIITIKGGFMILKTNKKAFTLIELTIVVGLIAIMAMVVYPNINNITDRAKTTVSDLNEKTIQQASIMGNALGNNIINESSGADISSIGNLQDITVSYTGSDDLYLLTSTNGSTWYSYRDTLNISKNQVLAAKSKIAVNSSNKEDVVNKGLTETLFNDLTTTDWNNIFANNDKVYFSYYTEDNSGNDTTLENSSNINISVTGTNNTVSVDGFDSENNNLGFDYYTHYLAFDGNDDNVQIDTGNINNSTNKETLDVFFQTSDDISSRQVIYEEGSTSNGFNIYLYNNYLYYSAWSENSGWGFKYIKTPIQTNSSYRATLVYNSSSSDFVGYLNHEKVGRVTGIGTMHSHSGLTGIGFDNNGTIFESFETSYSGYNFKGKIYEVRNFQGSAFTLGEIKNIPAGSLNGSEANLAALWCVDSSTNNTLKDFSGNGNEGSIDGATVY